MYSPIMRGGKLIGKGGYGCVFYPAVKCSQTGKRPEGNVVGKVFETAENAFDEMENNQILKLVDPTGLFTVRQLGMCKLRRNRFEPTDGVDRCEFADHSRSYQVMYEYGGMELDDVIRNVSNGASEEITVESLLPMFLNVLQGLVNITKLGYQHQDIKPYNLLVHDRGVLLIDFGLMQPLRKIYSDSNLKLLAATYFWYPPEFKLAAMLTRGPVVLDDFVQNFSRNFSVITLSFIVRHFEGQAQQLENMHRDMKTFDAFQKYADRVDVYSMGLSMLQLMNAAVARRRFENEAIVKDVYSLIHSMIQFDPRVRPTPSTLLAAFKEILSKHQLSAQKSISCAALSKSDLVKLYSNLGLPTTGSKKDLCEHWPIAVPLLKDITSHPSVCKDEKSADKLAKRLGLSAAVLCKLKKSGKTSN